MNRSTYHHRHGRRLRLWGQPLLPGKQSRKNQTGACSCTCAHVYSYASSTRDLIWLISAPLTRVLSRILLCMVKRWSPVHVYRRQQEISHIEIGPTFTFLPENSSTVPRS